MTEPIREQTEEEFRAAMPISGAVETFFGDFELDHSFPVGDTAERIYETYSQSSDPEQVTQGFGQLAEALRPAVDLFHETIRAEGDESLPAYRGALNTSGPGVEWEEDRFAGPHSGPANQRITRAQTERQAWETTCYKLTACLAVVRTMCSQASLSERNMQ